MYLQNTCKHSLQMNEHACTHTMKQWITDIWSKDVVLQYIASAQSNVTIFFYLHRIKATVYYILLLRQDPEFFVWCSIDSQTFLMATCQFYHMNFKLHIFLLYTQEYTYRNMLSQFPLIIQLQYNIYYIFSPTDGILFL